MPIAPSEAIAKSALGPMLDNLWQLAVLRPRSKERRDAWSTAKTVVVPSLCELLAQSLHFVACFSKSFLLLQSFLRACFFLLFKNTVVDSNL